MIENNANTFLRSKKHCLSYLRRNDNSPYGAVVAYVENNKVVVGWSVLSEDDAKGWNDSNARIHFVKARGRNLAVQRAQKQEDTTLFQELKKLHNTEHYTALLEGIAFVTTTLVNRVLIGRLHCIT